MISLWTAKVYLLRGVEALCLLSVFLFVGMILDWRIIGTPWQSRLWLGFISLFILVHHLVMACYMTHRPGSLVDVPFLLAEIAGLVFFILEVISVDRFAPLSNHSFDESPAAFACITVSSVIITFLFLEVLMKAGWKAKFYQQTGTYSPLQIMFGRSLKLANIKKSQPNESAQKHANGLSGVQGTLLLTRRILIRIVVICSCASLVLAPWEWQSLGNADYLWISLLPFVILHHLFSCINVEPGYVYFDLPLLLAEMACIAPWIQFVGTFNQWSSEPLIVYAFFASVIFGSLGIEALIRIGSLVFNSWALRSIDQEVHRKQSVLFGNTLWSERLSGESSAIILLRGIIALGFITILFFTSIFDVVLYPVREIGLTPTTDLRSQNVPQYANADIPVWNLAFSTPVNQTEDLDLNEWNDIFSAAVNVTPLWDQSGLPCVHVPENTQQLDLNFLYNSSLYLNNVYCPPRLPLVVGAFDYNIFPFQASDSFPDLLIFINFTALGGTAGNGLSDAFNRAVQVVIGFSNDTDKVVTRTLGTTILPGMNVVGSVTWELRQTLTSPRLSTFGLFDSSDTFVVSRLISVLPDPLAGKASAIPILPDVSTFRISLQRDISELRMLRDYRSQSVVGGFAQVGGLWTFLSGVFATIFGSSLLRILFNSKQISLVGLIHALQRKTIRDRCLHDYPVIEEQIHCQPHKKDLLSLLCDQLIDVQFLEDGEGTMSQDPSANPAVEPVKSDLQQSRNAVDTV